MTDYNHDPYAALGLIRPDDDADHAPSPEPTPKPAKGPTAESLPTLGEHDGTFYFLKHLTGVGDLADSAHEHGKAEICQQAINMAWLPDETTFRVHQAGRADDNGWDVLYAVDVVPNAIQG